MGNGLSEDRAGCERRGHLCSERVCRAIRPLGELLRHFQPLAGNAHHGRFDVLMPEEFLDGPDVVAILKQVGSETVPEGVTTDGFADVSQFDGLPDGLLHTTL